MIDRISSNQFSSQLRPAEIGETNTRNQERNLDYLPNTTIDEKQEYIIFPKAKAEEIIDELNKLIQNSHTSLKFEYHEKLNEYYVKIIDEKTKEVVREIPQKKMLDFYAAMTEFLGIVLDKKI